jgi:FlaA1/EpsC-like NDP-sugar epimerase
MRGLIWVTGAAGSIGSAVVDRIPNTIGTDLDVDVTDPAAVRRFVDTYQPESVIHCAGAKHAPEGETDPRHTASVNIDGTFNVLDVMGGRQVVLTSTCKAGDPETAYGASKLIAERAVLNAGGTVVRFFNVRETQGNVFDIWSSIPEPEPLPVMPCWRYFISLEQAVELVVRSRSLASGRYAFDPGDPVFIPDLADRLYPERDKNMVPPRRGDRVREPLAAASETVTRAGGLLRIEGPHDHPEDVPFGVGAGRPARRVSSVA